MNYITINEEMKVLMDRNSSNLQVLVLQVAQKCWGDINSMETGFGLPQLAAKLRDEKYIDSEAYMAIMRWYQLDDYRFRYSVSERDWRHYLHEYERITNLLTAIR